MELNTVCTQSSQKLTIIDGIFKSKTVSSTWNPIQTDVSYNGTQIIKLTRHGRLKGKNSKTLTED